MNLTVSSLDDKFVEILECLESLGVGVQEEILRIEMDRDRPKSGFAKLFPMFTRRSSHTQEIRERLHDLIEGLPCSAEVVDDWKRKAKARINYDEQRMAVRKESAEKN